MSNLASKLKIHDQQRIYVAAIFLLLAAVTWVAHFSSYQQFSLYFEDFARIPDSMQWGWSQVWEFLLEIPEAIVEAEYEGRPLHPGLIYLFSYLGERVGGLPALYVIAYIINLLNVFLFYSLMWRSTQQRFFALTSALGFALFPVNTNTAWLTGAFGILPALTLLLVALHLYLTNRRANVVISYFVIFVSVFCYEKFLPLFWVAPLLKPDWEWRLRSKREILRHTVILIFLLFVATLLRLLNGEGRVKNLDGGSLIQVLTSIAAGPIITLTTLVQRPIQALVTLKLEWFVLLSLLLLAIACSLYYSKLLSINAQLPLAEQPATPPRALLSRLVRLTIAGVAALILAYGLSLTSRINLIDPKTTGRQSLGHVAAIFGASVLCGCACYAIEFIANRYRKSLISTFVIALFFTLLIVNGFNVQQDYIATTQYQRAFWTRIAQLCPDMTNHTVILINFNNDRQELLQTYSFSGRFPRILGYLYKFPDEWVNDNNFEKSSQPKIYRLSKNWQNKILSNNNLLRIKEDTVVGRRDLAGNVKSSDVILLDVQDGKLMRQAQQLILGGQTLPLKQNDSPFERPPFEPNVLHDYFIIPGNEALVE